MAIISILAFIAKIIISLYFYIVGHKWLARVTAGVFTILIFVCCLVGFFLAIFEPIDESLQSTTKLFYAIGAAISLIGSTIYLSLCRIKNSV